MGAWGPGNFENDTALDWCYNLENSSDSKILWDAVEAVLQMEYVEADVACEALAAIEIAAEIKEKQSEYLPETVEDWLRGNSTLELPSNFYSRAESALEKITGNDSELNELWSESKSHKQWLAEMNSLKSRVTS